jgi:hypothetical protein
MHNPPTERQTMTALTTPDQIARYRLATLRAALKLEIAGMKRSRGPSAYAILKKEGFTGTRATVLQQLNNQLERADHVQA